MSDHIHIFTNSGLDRFSEKRTDEAWIDSLRGAADSRYIALQDFQPLVRVNGEGQGSLTLLTAGEMSELRLTNHTDPVLLGIDEAGAALFAAGVDLGLDLAALGQTIDLRTLGYKAMLQPHELSRAGLAKSLLDWHARHGFCSSCGAPDRSVRGGYMRHCDACGREHFPRVDPVVIMLAHREGKCLLGRSGRFMNNMYSALAGFVEPGEAIEEAVRREVKEEAGIDIGRVRYHSSQPWPFPSTLMIGCLAEALSDDIVIDPDELVDARWFTREEACQILDRTHPGEITAPLPFAIAHHLVKSFAAGEAG